MIGATRVCGQFLCVKRRKRKYWKTNQKSIRMENNSLKATNWSGSEQRWRNINPASPVSTVTASLSLIEINHSSNETSGSDHEKRNHESFRVSRVGTCRCCCLSSDRRWSLLLMEMEFDWMPPIVCGFICLSLHLSHSFHSAHPEQLNKLSRKSLWMSALVTANNRRTTKQKVIE